MAKSGAPNPTKLLEYQQQQCLARKLQEKKVNKLTQFDNICLFLILNQGSLLWVCLKKEDAPKIAIQWEI
jgi:hypothetical protein